MRGPITHFEVFCKVFVGTSFENATFPILEDPIWLQLIYFLTTTAFCFVKYVFPIDGNTVLLKSAIMEI